MFSCKKDDNSPVQLVKSISINDNLSYEFEYDEKNRISKIIQYNYKTIWLTYNRDDDLISLKWHYYYVDHFSPKPSLEYYVKCVVTKSRDKVVFVYSGYSFDDVNYYEDGFFPY